MQLQVSMASNDYQSAWAALQSTADEMQSTRESFDLTAKRYREGQALELELTDARIQMTNAAIRFSLARLAVLNKAAELERVKANYPLHP